MNPQEQTRRKCDCGVGWILTGVFSEHNVKNAAGKQVCSQCKINEFYANFLKTRSIHNGS